MDAHPRFAVTHPAYAAIDNDLNPTIPVYLEYPPAGWPDAFPPRRSHFNLSRWPFLRRFALAAKVQVFPAGLTY